MKVKYEIPKNPIKSAVLFGTNGAIFTAASGKIARITAKQKTEVLFLPELTYFVDFLIMGFWHGLTWYYIVYGIYHALAIIINDIWLRFKRKHRKQIPHNKFTKWFAIFLTFNVVCFSFLIFSGFLSTLWFGWK